MKKQIHLPLSKEEIRSLHAGDSVLITGTVYTARDAAHKCMCDLLNSQHPLPFDPENAAIYYVGPSPACGNAVLGAAGPTTASRCDPYTPALLKEGVSVLIGKGRRSAEVKEEIVRCEAVYLATTGGAGAMLSQCIKSSKVIAFDDLGTEAIRELFVENFPAVVINDCHGGDYYETARKNYLESLKS